MKYKKRSIVLGIVVVVTNLVLIACAPQAAPTIEQVVTEQAVTEKVVAEKVVEREVVMPKKWDAPYEKIPPDLCPPDKVCEGKLVFSDPAPEFYAGKEVWVQHGLFANEQDELFRMKVIGVISDTVKLYTEKVNVCLDQIFTGEVTAGSPPEPGLDQLPDGFGVNPQDLIIEIYLQGLVDPEKMSGRDVISQLSKFSAQEWAGLLEEMGVAPQQARPEELKQGYVVDYVVDPYVADSGTHYYPQRSATYAYVKVSVAVADGGAGSVTGELYRNTVSMDAWTVTEGGDPESAELSDNLGTWATYNVTVKGNSSGRYRLSGRTGYDPERASWPSEPAEPAPPCRAEDICLELTPGQSATHTITVTTDEVPIPKLDVLLLFDVSGSMGAQIEAVKANASYIMEAVKAKVPDAAFGVASFVDYELFYDYDGTARTDYGAPGDYPWYPDWPITTDTSAVQEALNALGLRNGADNPESYSRALFEAISIPWRAESKKVIVLFGDSVPHDVGFFQADFGENTGVDPGEDLKAGTNDDLDFAKVVDRLIEQRIEVIPVNSAPGDMRAVKCFDYLATQTIGQLFNLADAKEVPQAVAQGLEGATARIKQLTILPDPDFGSWVTVATPAYHDVGGGESRSFDVTITVPEGASPGLTEFDLTAVGDGATLDVFHVVLAVR